MKKQGFTLVEILGVIVILGLIMLLAFPQLMAQIKKGTKNIDSKTQELIYASARVYIDQNVNEFPIENGNTYCVTIQSLLDNGVLNKNLAGLTQSSKIDLSNVVKIEIENEANIDYSIVKEDQCIE